MLSLFLATSCQKETDKPAPDASKPKKELQGSDKNGCGTISKVNGRMVFCDRATFETRMASLRTEDEAKSFEQVYSFNSRRKYYESQNIVDTLVESDGFGAVLNTDDIVQIGTWIFKIDMTTQRAYILHQNDLSYYNHLVAKNLSSGKVLLFNTNSDVLDLLEDGYRTDPSLGGSGVDLERGKGRCSGDGCGREKDQESEIWAGGNNMLHAKLLYRRYGVYFEMFGKATSQGRGLFGYSARVPAKICADYTYSWKNKCNDTGKRSGVCFSSYCNECTSYHIWAYTGSRGLKEFQFEATFTIEDLTVAAPQQAQVGPLNICCKTCL
jgi:hypothetical protein